ncbi:hypothetical protein FRC17_002489 [Serendipita sp. 399]|nr:hypothetical protein FRC17_002489 [Serendipita sp. 399]
MLTHYETLGIAMGAKADEIVAAYRTAIMQVLPKHSLYPTSARALDQFRKVQDAYDCLIKPESREKYDAMLEELDAEERSLFGERKARRQSQEQEKLKAQKAPPPFVWNEDTNAPLFWTPGRKLIEGPKPEGEVKPVAYYRRASLDKALVLASAESSSDSSKSSTPSSKQLVLHRQSTQPPPPSTPAPVPAPTPAISISRSRTRATSFSKPPSPPTPTTISFTSSNNGIRMGQHRRRLSEPQPVPLQMSTMDMAQLQNAQIQAIEERHRRKVEVERMKAMHELEKRRRAVEKEQRRKQRMEEEARRMVDKERENRMREAERLRQRQEKENMKKQKQVRWAVTDAVFDPVPAYSPVETGPYYDDWYSEPEAPRTRHNVLRKRRPVA